MRNVIIALAILLCSALPARAQFSIEFGAPGVNIGINMPVSHARSLPGYPVYYDPQVNSNYFLRRTLLGLLGRQLVRKRVVQRAVATGRAGLRPQFRCSFRCATTAPPVYFRGWYRDGPPRWGEHWGHTWEQRRVGWDRWIASPSPPRAATGLPAAIFGQQLSSRRRATAGDSIAELSPSPREAVAQQHFQQRAAQAGFRGNRANSKSSRRAMPRARTQTQQPVQQERRRKPNNSANR